VYEELVAEGADLSYPALTAFCRHQGIGQKPKRAAGRYVFQPGRELQHDTSPHRTKIGGKVRLVQSAVGVLAFSHMIYFQAFPRFRRFECKIFLDRTARYFQGMPSVVMIDNTHVVVLHGTGAQMVPVPEMVTFGQRYGFTFEAHEKGDANRSALAERSLGYIEKNFFAGRSFADFDDLNQQGKEWCEQRNRRVKRTLRAAPTELFVTERAHLRPLPLWLPEPYLLHHRTVDLEGYVNLATNRYSVPEDWIGRSVQLRETAGEIHIDGPRKQCVRHRRLLEPLGKRVTLKEHRRPRKRRRHAPCPEEKTLAKEAPELAAYIKDLKKKGRRQTTLLLRRLLRMVYDYPRDPLLAAVQEAAHYGLYDLERVERMILRRISRDYFRLPPEGEEE